MKHKTEEIMKASKALAEMVLSAEKQCDLSKLDELELQRIKEVAHQARMVLGDFNAYDKSEDLDPLGC